MKFRFIKLLLEAYKTSNFKLHLILGTGISLMLLPYERAFILQFLIAIIFTTVIAGILEYGQKIFFPKAIPDMRDVITTGIYGGFSGWLIHQIIYGFTLYSENLPKDNIFLSTQFFTGLGLVVISITLWIIKQFKK
jgi:hypothetical protein